MEGREGGKEGRRSLRWNRQDHGCARCARRVVRLSGGERMAIDVEHRFVSCSALTPVSWRRMRFKRLGVILQKAGFALNFGEEPELPACPLLSQGDPNPLHCIAPESRRDGHVERSVFSLAWETRL